MTPTEPAAADITDPDPDPQAQEAAAAGDAPVATGPCSVTEQVRSGLQAADVRAALARAPPAKRAVANAIMLWDGRWVTSGPLADPRVLGPVRAAVSRAVADAPPRCAAELMTGPVIFMVPDGGGALVLVLGSGRWRWADVVAITSASRAASNPG